MKPTAQFKRNDNPSDTHEKDKNAQIEIQGLKVDMRDTSGIMSERINLYPKYPQSTTSSAVLAPKERSSGFVIFLMIVVCIGNYFFGY